MYSASTQGHDDFCPSMGVWHRSSPLRISLGMESRRTAGVRCHSVVFIPCRDPAPPLPKSPIHLFLPAFSRFSSRPCPDLRPGFLRVRGPDLQSGALGTAEPVTDGVVCSGSSCG